MNEMKYVVVETEGQGKQLFIFPKNIDHDSFAEVLSYIKVGSHQNWNRAYREPISAGFTDGKTCYGKSETLRLKSLPTDTALMLNGGVS
jgi:thioredoxin-related protein